MQLCRLYFADFSFSLCVLEGNYLNRREITVLLELLKYTMVTCMPRAAVAGMSLKVKGSIWVYVSCIFFMLDPKILTNIRLSIRWSHRLGWIRIIQCSVLYLARMSWEPVRGPRPTPPLGEFFRTRAGEMDVVLCGIWTMNTYKERGENHYCCLHLL